MSSSNVGILLRSRIIALLGSRMSMHSRMELSFFGGVTMGDTHGVGSPTGTFSMVSSGRSLCSSSSIFGLIWKGIFLLVIATGLSHGLIDVLFDLYILQLANTLCETGVCILPIRADLFNDVHKT